MLPCTYWQSNDIGTSHQNWADGCTSIACSLQSRVCTLPLTLSSFHDCFGTIGWILLTIQRKIIDGALNLHVSSLVDEVNITKSPHYPSYQCQQFTFGFAANETINDAWPLIAKPSGMPMHNDAC